MPDGREIRVESMDISAAFARTRTSLIVGRGDSTRRVQLDDDVGVAQIRLVELGQWLLVVNGDVVMGGLDTKNDVLVGEHEWGKLPITIWKGEGRVVATGPFRTASVGRPAGFPGE